MYKFPSESKLSQCRSPAELYIIVNALSHPFGRIGNKLRKQTVSLCIYLICRKDVCLTSAISAGVYYYCKREMVRSAIDGRFPNVEVVDETELKIVRELKTTSQT